jgi:DNA-binding transcriptional MerR regulator
MSEKSIKLGPTGRRRSAAGLEHATVSDMVSLFGLTARAIRFYEERGLISPERDRHNCRQFRVEDRERLAIISMLRRAGLSLDEIAAVVASPAPDARRLSTAYLTARIGRLERQLADARLAMERLTFADAA